MVTETINNKHELKKNLRSFLRQSIHFTMSKRIEIKQSKYQIHKYKDMWGGHKTV